MGGVGLAGVRASDRLWRDWFLQTTPRKDSAAAARDACGAVFGLAPASRETEVATTLTIAPRASVKWTRHGWRRAPWSAASAERQPEIGEPIPRRAFQPT
jgi:hypothetical protein